MKKKTTLIYSIFASLIYILSITYFIYNLSAEYLNGTSRTQKRFDHTSVCVKQTLTKISENSFSSSKIQELMNTSFGNFNDFAYIELFENGNTIFKFKEDTLAQNQNNKLLKNYFKTFKIGEENYYLAANLYVLRPSSIFYYGKISFLVILIVTLITFLLLIIINAKACSTETKSEKEEIADSTKNYESETKVRVEKENIETLDDSINPIVEIKNIENEEENNLQNNKNKSETSPFEEHATAKLDEIETSANSAEQTANVNTINEISADNKTEEIKPELNSEVTIETRLNDEINKAISSESDISLFLIKIQNFSRKDERMQKILNYLADAFQSKELLFEYKEDTIAAVKVNSSIDDSITSADEIYQNIINIINDSFIKCFIGITSRTVRMVSAKRLLLEAEQALKHAVEEKENPIVAFRANADKFREYIEAK